MFAIRSILALCLVAFVGSVSLAAPISQAPTSIEASVFNTYSLGPYQVSAYGATEAIAKAKAEQAMNDFVDDVEDNLPPGHIIMGVTQMGSWDGFEYTIDFTIWVLDTTSP